MHAAFNACARALSLASLLQPPAAAALELSEAVAIALRDNPEVHAAEARWHATEHQVLPTLAPPDPTVTYANADSPSNGITQPALRSLQLVQPVPFPWKPWLQETNARRATEIARLSYEAVVRDVRADVETAFDRLVLDGSLRELARQNARDLSSVLRVADVAYAAGKVSQLDFVSAEFDLAAAEQQERQLETTIATDRIALNRLLRRSPDEPLEVAATAEPKRIEERVEVLVAAATAMRQEILEAALAAESAETALSLARLEYAPDFTLGYTFDAYQSRTVAPDNAHLRDHGFSLGFTVPVFFWLRQREDVEAARRSLEAARADLSSIRVETAATVAELVRRADGAERELRIDRDSLIGLAEQGVRVALAAYEAGRIDYVALTAALRRRNDARGASLQAANELLADRIALERVVGHPLDGGAKP